MKGISSETGKGSGMAWVYSKPFPFLIGLHPSIILYVYVSILIAICSL